MENTARLRPMCPRRPRSPEEADALAASRRIAAAVAAMSQDCGVAFMHEDHPVWQLADEEEVRAWFEAILTKVGKASDLPLAGDRTPASELIRVATSGDRHNARYRATLAAAVLAQYDWELTLPDCRPSQALTALCFEVDHIGSGGPRDLGFGSSQRDGAFSRLGSGRRQANDGPAWEAAREAAAWELGGYELRDDPTLKEGERPLIFVVVHNGAEAAVSIENICASAKEHGGGVLYALLGRALLAAHSTKLNGADPGVKVQGQAQAWEYIFTAYSRAIKEGQQEAAALEAALAPAPIIPGDDW
jgi:hypothetical protein